MAIAGAKTWVEISSSALRHNISALVKVLDPGVRFCAIVKANAYGHGIREVVTIAAEEGVSLFGVDSVDEAIIVRALAPEATIFIMGATVSERLADVVRIRAIQAIFDVPGVRSMKDAAEKMGIPALITLEIETGLHRLGADHRGLMDVLEACKAAMGFVYVVSIATHLASAEDVTKKKDVAAQYDIFLQAQKELYRKGFNPEHMHIGCSAAAILSELPQGSCVRFGICMYGLWPSKDARRAGAVGKRHADIKPVLSWKTRIAQIKDVPTGGGIGYGPTAVVNRPTRIAVLPIGYYDSFVRGFSNNGAVLIHGTKCPVIGNVCMNMTMIDVSNVPGVLTANTEVTIIGRDGMHSMTADELADRVGTINYEIVTRINPLIPRVVI